MTNSDAKAVPSRRTAYLQGLVSTVLNPKPALLFLTFLPQFVDETRPVLPQITFLAGVHIFIGLIWLTIYAQLIQRQSDKEAQHMRAVGVILSESERMAGIVKKIGKITKYETTDYVGSARMLDLDRAAPDQSDPAIPVMTDDPHDDKTGEFQAVTPTEESGLQHPSLADLVDLGSGVDKGRSR